jgi:uncharacterized protein YndB with AHSA1/START domain
VSDRSAVHDTFVIERTYEAEPQRVFDAWAEPEAKLRWFGSPEGHEFDFRVGGRERFRAALGSGDVYAYDGLYQDIVAGERIVYTYDMHRNEDRISVSLSTVELIRSGEGTLLRYTEQGVFLDGHDTSAQREQGTREMLEKLGGVLAAESGVSA